MHHEFCSIFIIWYYLGQKALSFAEKSQEFHVHMTRCRWGGITREGGDARAYAPRTLPVRYKKTMVNYSLICPFKRCLWRYLYIQVSVRPFQAVNRSKLTKNRERKAGEDPDFALHCGMKKWWLHMEFRLSRVNQPISERYCITWPPLSKGAKLRMLYYPPRVIQNLLFSSPICTAQHLVLPL